MDEVDMTQIREEFQQALMLSHRPQAAAPYAGDCLDCAEPITAVRKSLGSKLCLDCQVEQERIQSIFRRQYANH